MKIFLSAFGAEADDVEFLFMNAAAAISDLPLGLTYLSPKTLSLTHSHTHAHTHAQTSACTHTHKLTISV